MGVRCVLGGVGSLHIFCSFLSFVIFFFYPRFLNLFSNIEVFACQGEKKTCEVPKGLSGYPVFCGSALTRAGEMIGK